MALPRKFGLDSPWWNLIEAALALQISVCCDSQLYESLAVVSEGLERLVVCFC